MTHYPSIGLPKYESENTKQFDLNTLNTKRALDLLGLEPIHLFISKNSPDTKGEGGFVEAALEASRKSFEIAKCLHNHKGTNPQVYDVIAGTYGDTTIKIGAFKFDENGANLFGIVFFNENQVEKGFIIDSQTKPLKDITKGDQFTVIVIDSNLRNNVSKRFQY